MTRPYGNRKRRGGHRGIIRRVDGTTLNSLDIWSYERKENPGEWFSLIRGPFLFYGPDNWLNRAERSYVRKHAGCILIGLKAYWYKQRDSLEEAWATLTKVE